MRAKRHRDSLSPTRGSRGKGAWCCHPSKPARHGLSILRLILHTAASSGYRRCRYRMAAQSSSTNSYATSRRARPAAAASLSGISLGVVGLALRHLGYWGGEIVVMHAGAPDDSIRRKLGAVGSASEAPRGFVEALKKRGRAGACASTGQGRSFFRSGIWSLCGT